MKLGKVAQTRLSLFFIFLDLSSKNQSKIYSLVISEKI